MLKFFPCVYIYIRFPGKHCLASAADFDFLKLIVRVCYAGRIDQHDIYMGFDVGPAKNEGANQNLVVSSGLLPMQACWLVSKDLQSKSMRIWPQGWGK